MPVFSVYFHFNFLHQTTCKQTTCDGWRCTEDGFTIFWCLCGKFALSGKKKMPHFWNPAYNFILLKSSLYFHIPQTSNFIVSSCYLWSFFKSLLSLYADLSSSHILFMPNISVVTLSQYENRHNQYHHHHCFPHFKYCCHHIPPYSELSLLSLMSWSLLLLSSLYIL